MNKSLKLSLKFLAASFVVLAGVTLAFSSKIYLPEAPTPTTSGSDDIAFPTNPEFKDGVFTGTARGHNRGDLTVEVTIADGIITEVVVVSHTETKPLTDEAIVGIPAAIVAQNTYDVDETYAGVTVTSKAIKTAVFNALKSALYNYKSGTYQGTARGHNRGDLTVEVTVDKDIITAVSVLSHTETTPLADEALIGIPAAIVAANSYEIDDTYAGATVTSNAIKTAVKNALNSARQK